MQEQGGFPVQWSGYHPPSPSRVGGGGDGLVMAPPPLMVETRGTRGVVGRWHLGGLNSTLLYIEGRENMGLEFSIFLPGCFGAVYKR